MMKFNILIVLILIPLIQGSDDEPFETKAVEMMINEMRAVYREYKDIEATLESHCLKLTLNLWEFFSEVPKCVVQAIIQWFSVYDWNCISGKVEYAFNQCKESARQTKSELDNIDASCGSSPLCPYKKDIVEEEYYATCQNILQMYLPNLSVDCKKNSTSSRLSKKV